MPPTHSSVSWHKRIYLGLKLHRSTDATLREMHGLARRNDCFRTRTLFIYYFFFHF